jgi:hypothetical protein
MRSGEPERALAMFERRASILESALGPGEPQVARAKIDVAWASIRNGDRTGAHNLWRENERLVLERLPSAGLGVARDVYNLACLAALVGDQTRAIELLRRALDAGFAHEVILSDPDLDSLRDRPELAEMIAEVGERLGG